MRKGGHLWVIFFIFFQIFLKPTNKLSLYSLEMKAKFICWFEKNLEENKENNPEMTTFAHCERKHGICRKAISSWISKKDQIFAPITKEIWKEFDSDIIKKSFFVCGINE